MRAPKAEAWMFVSRGDAPCWATCSLGSSSYFVYGSMGSIQGYYWSMCIYLGQRSSTSCLGPRFCTNTADLPSFYHLKSHPMCSVPCSTAASPTQGHLYSSSLCRVCASSAMLASCPWTDSRFRLLSWGSFGLQTQTSSKPVGFVCLNLPLWYQM